MVSDRQSASAAVLPHVKALCKQSEVAKLTLLLTDGDLVGALASLAPSEPFLLCESHTAFSKPNSTTPSPPWGADPRTPPEKEISQVEFHATAWCSCFGNDMTVTFIDGRYNNINRGRKTICSANVNSELTSSIWIPRPRNRGQFALRKEGVDVLQVPYLLPDAVAKQHVGWNRVGERIPRRLQEKFRFAHCQPKPDAEKHGRLLVHSRIVERDNARINLSTNPRTLVGHWSHTAAFLVDIREKPRRKT